MDVFVYDNYFQNDTFCKKDYETLKAQGIEILKAPENMPWGISMSFNDNSGNKIYVCQQV